MYISYNNKKMEEEKENIYDLVIMFDSSKTLFSTDKTGSLLYKSWLVVNHLIQSLLALNHRKEFHIHVSLALCSGRNFRLLVHDYCLPEDVLRFRNEIKNISSYESWARLLSLTFEGRENDTSEICMHELLQTFIYLVRLMTSGPCLRRGLILITGQTQSLPGLHTYESVLSQIAALNAKCLSITLSDIYKKQFQDYQAINIVRRLGGINLHFRDIISELPDSLNYFHFVPSEGGEYTALKNQDCITSKLPELTGLKSEFHDKIRDFLNLLTIKSNTLEKVIKPKSSLSWKLDRNCVGVDEYTLECSLDVIKHSRITETFKVTRESLENFSASLVWKPNIKLIYYCSINNSLLSVSLKIKTTKPILSALFHQSTLLKRKSLLYQLKQFMNGIRMTDRLSQTIFKINNKDIKQSEKLLQELAVLPVCSYHKWLELKCFDVVYSTKASTRKRRGSVLADFIVLKKCLSSIFSNLNLIVIEEGLLVRAQVFEKGFLIVKPVFFLPNIVTLYIGAFQVSQELTQSLSGKLCEQIGQYRKLRVFHRPLRLLLSSVDHNMTSFKEEAPMHELMTMPMNIIQNNDEEKIHFLGEETEELEQQQILEGIGASAYIFVPYNHTIMCYMQNKEFYWICEYDCVLHSYISILTKQRISEGFVLLSATPNKLIFAKEQDIMACPLVKNSKLLLQYIIKYDKEAHRIKTQFCMEKKMCLIENEEQVVGKYLFENICDEIYKIDLNLMTNIWALHKIRKDCLLYCTSCRQNSLKHCAFFFESQETQISESVPLRLYMILINSFQNYVRKKYKSVIIPSEVKGNRINEKTFIDIDYFFQKSTALRSQTLPILDFSQTLSPSTQDFISIEENRKISQLIKSGIREIISEFSDTTIESDFFQIFAKIVSQKQVVLIKIDSSKNDIATIEYRSQCKQMLIVEESFMISRYNREQRKSKRLSKTEYNDEFIHQVIEDMEIDFDIYAESDVQFETSLLTVVKNFESFILEEYNNMVLSVLYNLIVQGYIINMEILETALQKSHKLVFAFDVTSLILMFSAMNIKKGSAKEHINMDILNVHLKSFLSIYFTEFGETGYYYYKPKKEEDYSESDKALMKELDLLYPRLINEKFGDLPLFLKFTAVYNQIESPNRFIIHKYKDLFNETILSQTPGETSVKDVWGKIKTYVVTIEVTMFFFGEHKTFQDESYYEKVDIDTIPMEGYYDQFSEGVAAFEDALANVVMEETQIQNKIVVNMNAYMDTSNAAPILYPFQPRLFQQLIPENYVKGSYIFSLSDEYNKVFYSVLRSLKTVFAEHILSYITNLSIEMINEDLIRYVRLKMGELYSYQLINQKHQIGFIKNSSITLKIFYEELNSMQYNFRQMDNYYYVVWEDESPSLKLNSSVLKTNGGKSLDLRRNVKYWIIFEFEVLKDLVEMQLFVHFPFGESRVDTEESVEKEFENTCNQISKKVSQRILLFHMNVEKECPDLLFPVAGQNDAQMSSSKETRRKNTYRRKAAINKSHHKRFSTKVKEEEEPTPVHQPEKAVLDYTPGLLLTKEFSINERLSLDKLSSHFLDSFRIQNRKYMYAISSRNVIYVLKFSEDQMESDKLIQKGSFRQHMIKMELYGIDELQADFINQLILTIESQLTMIALKLIAHNINLASGTLSLYDYHFLVRSECQVSLLFPLPEIVGDPYSLMKYLSQSMRKIMGRCKLDSMAKRYINLAKSPLFLNSSPILMKSPVFGKVEKFILSQDDFDFTLVFNFIMEVGSMILGQIFGDGLGLIKLSALEIGAESLQDIINSGKVEEKCVLKQLDRYAPLTKFKQDSPWCEFISVIEGSKFDSESQEDSILEKGIFPDNFNSLELFTYPLIVRKHCSLDEEKKEQHIVESEEFKQIRSLIDNKQESSSKYLRVLLNTKGNLNTEAFINTVILLTNQAIADYAFEQATELLELGIWTGLGEGNTSLEHKKKMLIKKIKIYIQSIEKIYQFAESVKAPLFFKTSVKASTDYRNHIPLMCKIIQDIIKDVLLTTMNHSQLESLCIYLFVYVTNNSDKSIHKIYIVKSPQNTQQLYTFLRKNLGLSEIELKNRVVDYEFFLLSKASAALAKMFKQEMRADRKYTEDSKVTLIDCSNSGLLMNPRTKGYSRFLESVNSESTIISYDETMEEYMGSIKAQPSIQIKSECTYHSIPRTVFLKISLKNSVADIYSYNFNKKNIEAFERILNLAVVWHNKKSQVLTKLLVTKMGIVSKRYQIQESKSKTFLVPKSVISGVITDFIQKALNNQLFIDLNQITIQEKISKVDSGWAQPNNDKTGKKIVPVVLKISDFAGSLSLSEKEQANLDSFKKIKLNGYKIVNGNSPRNLEQLSLLCSDFYEDVLANKNALKYLMINPLYYHCLRSQIQYQLFEKNQHMLRNKLQFYKKYARLQDTSPERKNREEKLFQFINLDSVSTNDQGKILASILSMSSLYYSYTFPFLFNQIILDEKGDSSSKKAFVKNIMESLFLSLCEMLKTNCGFSGMAITYGSRNKINDSVGPSKKRYYGRSTSDVDYQEVPDLSFGPIRKTTSISSISSKQRDVLFDKDDRSLFRPTNAMSKGMGNQQPYLKGCKLKETEAFLIKTANNAAYIVQISTRNNSITIKIWLINDLINAEYLPSEDRVFLGETELFNWDFAKSHSSVLWVDHQLNNMLNMIKLDAFNYDFHIKYFLTLLTTIRQQCPFFNILSSFMRFYLEPPKKSKNSIKSVLITIYMGDIKGNPKAFWEYFVQKADQFGYSPITSNKLVYCKLTENETFQEMANSRNASYTEDRKDSPGEFSAIMIIENNTNWNITSRVPVNKMKRQLSAFMESEKEESSSPPVKNAFESCSSSKETFNYSSYAVLMYCKNALEIEGLVRRKTTLSVQELDDKVEIDPEKNKIQIELCGIQALAQKLEEYGNFPEAVPPRIQFDEIEETLFRNLVECKRHYINDLLWTKLAASYDSPAAEVFTYEDLRKLNHYSVSSNIVAFNRKYSELLFVYEDTYQRFLELLKVKYMKRLKMFTDLNPSSSLILQVDERSKLQKGFLRFSRMSVLNPNRQSTFEKETNYLLVPEDYHIPVAIHIIYEDGKIMASVLRKFGQEQFNNNVEHELINEVCNLYVYCSFLTLIK